VLNTYLATLYYIRTAVQMEAVRVSSRFIYGECTVYIDIQYIIIEILYLTDEVICGPSSHI